MSEFEVNPHPELGALRDTVHVAQFTGLSGTEIDPALTESTANTLAALMHGRSTQDTNYITRPYSIPAGSSELEPVEFSAVGDLTGFVVNGGQGKLEAVSRKHVLQAPLSAGVAVVFSSANKARPWFRVAGADGLEVTWVESEHAQSDRNQRWNKELDQGAIARRVSAQARLRQQEKMQAKLDRRLRQLGRTATHS